MNRTVSRFSRSLIAVALVAARVAFGQSSQPAGNGTISGSVIDATTASPLARATVTLTSGDGFAVLLGGHGTGTPAALARTVTTFSAGTYRFTDLPIGAYRLRIARVGYEPATVDVRLGDTGTSPLSIGLVILPVRLRAVEVRAHSSGTSAGDRESAVREDDRLAAIHARQHELLSTDARELTAADVAESATLGGSDVFRALQRLPGVTQRDDWSAQLWVRENRWDHNRTYYDGLPLFDPLGMLGRTTGVSADAIGGAFLHPGVRPVWLGGEGATRIDLRSRPASGGGNWRGAAELSQAGASGSLERTRSDSSAGLLVTAQHSLGRWLPREAFFDEALAGRTYSDAQATMRADLNLGAGRRVETSGLFTRDTRDFSSDLTGNEPSQSWGNAVGRVTFYTPIGTLATSHTVGVSRFTNNTMRWFGSTTGVGSTPDSVIERPATSSVDYFTVGGRVGSSVPSRDATTGGYDLIAQRSQVGGTNQNILFGNVSQALTSRRTAISYGSFWIDRRTELGDVTIENGLRLDVGGSHGLDAVRPAGSAQVLFAASPSTRMSVGVSRVHQYVQAIDLLTVGQGQTVSASWLTSGGDVPVMSVDNAMAGIEHWVGPGVLLAANAYVRRTSGAIADDPTPGVVTNRPLFVPATESASGVELSARKLVGRTTGLVAYSYGDATMNARGLSFSAPASRPHALNTALSVHLGGFDVGGAYTLTSGAPYTRTMVDAAASPLPVREAPYAKRLPAYESFDVSLDYARAVAGGTLMVFGGVQNVFRRTNSTWYEISGYCENGQSQLVAGPQCRDHDVLAAPVKFAPTVGLRFVVR